MKGRAKTSSFSLGRRNRSAVAPSQAGNCRKCGQRYTLNVEEECKWCAEESAKAKTRRMLNFRPAASVSPTKQREAVFPLALNTKAWNHRELPAAGQSKAETASADIYQAQKVFQARQQRRILRTAGPPQGESVGLQRLHSKSVDHWKSSGPAREASPDRINCPYIRKAVLRSFCLKSMLVADRNLKTIPDDAVSTLAVQLGNVLAFRFPRNRIRTLEKQAFEDLEFLRELDLSYNDIAVLPSSIGCLVKLLRLLVDANKLKELPEELLLLRQLQELHLSKNCLIALPDSIGRLQNLRVLNISHNSLLAFPHTLHQLTQLSHLDCSFNELWYVAFVPQECLPRALSEGKHGNDYEFSISSDSDSATSACSGSEQRKEMECEPSSDDEASVTREISGYPAVDDKLKEQLKLPLDFIKKTPKTTAIFIQSVEESGETTPVKDARPWKLKLNGDGDQAEDGAAVLNVAYFENVNTEEIVTVIPKFYDKIALLKNLSYLDLSYNRLSCLPSMIRTLPKIEVLKLDGNRFHNFPSDALLNPPIESLKELRLANNFLCAIPEDIYHLPSIRTLDLSRNKIRSFPFVEFLEFKIEPGASKGQFSTSKIDRKQNLHDLNELSMRSKPLPSATNGRWKPKLSKIEGLDENSQDDDDEPPSNGRQWPWPKLEYFSLAENLLQEIPEGIAYITKAKTVTLFGNPLRASDRAVVSKDLEQLLWFCRQKILRRRQGLEPKAMVLKKGIDGERLIPGPKFDQDVNVAVAEGECVNEAETYCNQCRHSFCSACFWTEHEEDSQGNIVHKAIKDGAHQVVELDKTKDKAYQFWLNQRHRLKGLLSARNNNTQRSDRSLATQCSPREAHSSRVDLEDSFPHVNFSSEAILCRKGSGVVNLGWASLSHWPNRFHQCRMLHTVVLDGNNLKKLMDAGDFLLAGCTTLKSSKNPQENNGVQAGFMDNRSSSHLAMSTRGGRSGGRGRGRGRGRDLSLLPGVGHPEHFNSIESGSVATNSQVSSQGSQQQTTLDIGQVPQKATSSKKFPMLYKIKHLSLRSCGLRGLPDFVSLFGSLRELQLENNYIYELPVSLGDLIHLRQLSLSGNQLHELPESLGNLQNLQVLELENNKLTELPKSIGRLTALQFLSVNVNKLSALPGEMGQLKSLCCFRAMRNKLNATPPGLELLPNLEELNLSYNEIEELSEAFVQSPYLPKCMNTFSIYGNKIVDLHPTIHRFSQLKILGLSHNPLRSPPKEMGELPVADILLYCKEREERLERIENALLRCSCVELNTEGIIKYTTKDCITDSWGFLTNRDRHEIDQLVDHYINANFRSYTVSCDEIISRIVVRRNSRRHEVYESIYFALARLLPHIGAIGPPPEHLSQHIEFPDLDLMQSTKEKRKLRKREQARHISTAETSLQSQAKRKRNHRRKDRDDSSTDEDDGWWAARKVRKEREKEKINLEQIQQERLQRKQTLKRKLTLAGVNQHIRLTKKHGSALMQSSKSFRSTAGHSQIMSINASDSSSFSDKRSIVVIDGRPRVSKKGANSRWKCESIIGNPDHFCRRGVTDSFTAEVGLSAFPSLSLGADTTQGESRNQLALSDCEQDWNDDEEEDTLQRVIRLCRRQLPAPMRYTVIDLDAVMGNCWETEKSLDGTGDEAPVVAPYRTECSPTRLANKPKDRTIEAEYKGSDLELGSADDQSPESALPSNSKIVQDPDLTTRQHADYFCPFDWPIPVPSSCFEHISLLTNFNGHAKASSPDRDSTEVTTAEQTKEKSRGPFDHKWTLMQLPTIPSIPASISVKRLSLLALLRQHLSFLETSITEQILLDALTVHEGPLGVAAAIRPTSAREARAGNRIEQIIIDSTESHGRGKTGRAQQALVIPQLLLTMEQQERKLQEDDRIMTEVDAKVDEIVEYFFQHNENGFLDRFAIRRKKEAKKRLKPLKKQLSVEEKKMQELSEMVAIAREEGDDVSDEDTRNLSGMREDVEEKRSIVAGLTKICKQNREQNAIDLAADLFAIACSQRYDKVIRTLRLHAYTQRLLRPWDDDYTSLVEKYEDHMLEWNDKHCHKLSMSEFVVDTSTDMDEEEKEEERVRKELLRFQTQESLEVHKGLKTWQAVRKLCHSGGREKRVMKSALSEVEEEDANSSKVAYSYWGTVLEDILIPRSKEEMEERQMKRRERLQEKKRLLERKIAERKEQARKERMREKSSILTEDSFTGSCTHSMNDEPQLRPCKTSQGDSKYTKFSLQFSLKGRRKNKTFCQENKGQNNEADEHPSTSPILVGDVGDNVQVAQEFEQGGPVTSGTPQTREGSQSDESEVKSSVVGPSSLREESNLGLSESRSKESAQGQDTDLSDGEESVLEGSEDSDPDSGIQAREAGVFGSRSEGSTGMSGVDIDDSEGITEDLDSAFENDSSERPQ